jgi:hypothetical protein
MVWRMEAIRYLICENCLQVVASFHGGDVSIPITGEMFQSKFPPEREVRPPWLPGVESAFMRCPVCPKRVFNTPNPTELRVSDFYEGYEPYQYEIVQPGANGGLEEEAFPEVDMAEKCDRCGRYEAEFKNRSGFVNHRKFCKGKK